MNQRPTLREQMDACRPDSDDLHLPEHAADLAELHVGLRESAEVRGQWEKSRQDGRMIQIAMQDVSLPAGLEARLLAAMKATDDAPQVSPAAPQRRRFLQVAAGLVAVAASAMVAFVTYQNWPQAPQEIAKDQLATEIEGLVRAGNDSKMAMPTKPQALPGGVLGAVAGTSSISTSSGKMTAYSLTLRGGRGGNAILLVIPTTRIYPVDALPYSKIGISGGWEVGAWQKGGVLYVLAVRTGGRLEDFVRPPQVG
ncbi:MAG: hypothetical protein ACR2FY_25980 [Pirellulaceae bacterium]